MIKIDDCLDAQLLEDEINTIIGKLYIVVEFNEEEDSYWYEFIREHNTHLSKLAFWLICQPDKKEKALASCERVLWYLKRALFFLDVGEEKVWELVVTKKVFEHFLPKEIVDDQNR